MAATAWSASFKINKDDSQIAERIRAFDRPQRRGPQPPIPGPVYERVVAGQAPAPAEFQTLARPYPWDTAAADRWTVEPIVGYKGHRQRQREVFSQSTSMALNPTASTSTDPWQSTAAANFTGHKGEVERLARCRSQNINDRLQTMRDLSASATVAPAPTGC